ncbi:hypothetical protein EMCRGX_G019331 [Ephydatia muelleri]
MPEKRHPDLSHAPPPLLRCVGFLSPPKPGCAPEDAHHCEGPMPHPLIGGPLGAGLHLCPDLQLTYITMIQDRTTNGVMSYLETCV